MAGRVDKKKLGCNQPRGTPTHKRKSHVVKACAGGKEKLIRFGEQGAKTAGAPKAGESSRMKKKRKSFKSRHGKNIKKGTMSAAYWADRVKWASGGEVKDKVVKKSSSYAKGGKVDGCAVRGKTRGTKC